MEYKLSQYIYFVNSQTSTNHIVVYSTISNVLLKISNHLATILQEGKFDKIPSKTLNLLMEKKILKSKEEEELQSIINENYQSNIDNTNLYEVIQPSAWCQLGCYYCGQNHTKDKLSDQLVHKITERIYKKLEGGKYKTLNIGWFGGEPLTGFNTMRKINNILKSHCKKLGIEIKGSVLVTNGMSLKPNIYKELVEDFKIDHIEVTIDGIGKLHDEHRYQKKDNRGSFDIIYNNIKNIVNSYFYDITEPKIMIRCNVDSINFGGVEKFIKKLAEDNIHTKIKNLYFASIYSWANNDAHKISLTKPEFAYHKLKWEILKIKLGYKTTSSLKRKLNTCILTTSDSDMYDTFGNVYSCTEVSLTDIYKESKYFIGNIEDEIKGNNNREYSDWYDKVWDNKSSQCNSCKLFPVCGSACPKSWMEGIPPCPPFRFNIREEIRLKEILSHSDSSDFFNLLDSFDKGLDINLMHY